MNARELAGKIALGYQDEVNKPSDECPHCGMSASAPVAAKPTAAPKDDVPDPNPKAAADFQSGMSQQPNYLQNLKKGLGF